MMLKFCKNFWAIFRFPDFLGPLRMYHIKAPPKSQFLSTYSSSLLQPTSRGEGGGAPPLLAQTPKSHASKKGGLKRNTLLQQVTLTRQQHWSAGLHLLDMLRFSQRAVA